MAYKKITRDELDVFLRKHKLWLIDSTEGERADLRGANLYGADLREANLREANLYEADLYGADLRGANLREANLYGADLRGANLRGADLREANLREANLYEADLRGANFYCPIACPEKGSFTAFKKVSNEYIVELIIPEDALRSSATSRKCRASKARVVSITTPDGNDDGVTSIASGYDSSFVYTIGETVEVADFDPNRWNECAPGIHFFITRDEAVRY